MSDQLDKQALSLGDALKEYWSKAEPYHPGILGAAGGAAFAGLGTMSRRANENPRQRALRIIRNAAAGGLLGGTGAQLIVPGTKTFVKGVMGPPPQESKPGFASSIPARLGYVGTMVGAGNIAKRRRLISSLEKALPYRGIGPIRLPSSATTLQFPSLAGNNLLTPAARTEAARQADNIFRNVAKSPAALKELINELANRGVTNPGSAPPGLDKFLRSTYSQGGPLQWRKLDRTLNFMGGTAHSRVGRMAGRGFSAGAIGAAAFAPELANKFLERGGQTVEKGLKENLREAFLPPEAPAAPAEESWVDQLTKGRRFF